MTATRGGAGIRQAGGFELRRLTLVLAVLAWTVALAIPARATVPAV